jgi:hypothetical protein
MLRRTRESTKWSMSPEFAKNCGFSIGAKTPLSQGVACGTPNSLNQSGVRLLKCLCQTEEEKALAWHSDARSLERQGIPREFVTKSRVIIIANDWKTLNKNVAALQDRGHVLHFQPGAAEVHA